MVRSGGSRFLSFITVFLLLPLSAVSADLTSPVHIVSPNDLHNEVVGASRARQHDLETINRLFSSPKAKEVLETAGIDPASLRTAAAALSDQELALLAVRCEKAQADFAAGRMSDRDLLLILICLVALILIIVAVH